MIEERHHAVLLGEEVIGGLHHVGDVVRFNFDDDYWANPDRQVLGTWFEDHPRASPRAALRLPAWFSNLLPEGRLREWIALDRGVSAAREMELLLRVGEDLPGAIRVVEDAGVGDEREVGPPLELPEPGSADLWKFSLAGVGLKFSMLREDDRLTVPATDKLGDWIVKLPDANHREVPRNEFAMMGLAARVGIDVPEIRLVERKDLPDLPEAAWPGLESTAFAIARFDRTDGGDRVHIEDLAQVRGFYPEAKYEGSFETIAALTYRGYDTESLQEFARRLTFCLLIGNGDAHLKNWSLIYHDGRTAKLSPAYDLVSTAPYITGRDEDLGLKLGGSRRFAAASWRDFERIELRLGAHGAALSEVVEETITRFEHAWADAAGLSELDRVEEWISRELRSRRLQLLR